MSTRPSEDKGRSLDGPVLDIRNLSKSFGGTRALDQVSLLLDSGTVHALMGGNGSGKSTLIKCLSGFHTPDSGSEIWFQGRPRQQAGGRGIAFVHQDLGLVPSLSVMENMALGHGFKTGFAGRINWRQERTETAERLAAYGIETTPDTLVGSLSPALAASVAIARALQAGNGTTVLVLDEPTASLPERERERLLDVIRLVRDQGTAILYVSHRMQEVLEISDVITVLRDGHKVGTFPRAEVTEASLVESMLGSALGARTSRAVSSRKSDVARLQVNGLSSRGVHNVSFTVAPGEIVGLTGLLGAGQNELGRLVFGADRPDSGVVLVDGSPVPAGKPAESIRRGMAYVPADRTHESTIPLMSVRENMTLASLSRFTRLGRISGRQEREAVRGWLDDYDVKPRATERAIANLSGGNQQKSIVGKWLEKAPSILVLDEPTQGVDVGARADIYRLVEGAAAGGTAVLLIDTDVDELVNRADRVLVLGEGAIVGELAGADLTRERVLELTQGLEHLSE